MQNRKKIRIIIILLTLFFITSFILSMTISTERTINMFWGSFALLFCGILLDINKWSKIGLDVDKNNSRTIRRAFDDSTTVSSVFIGTLTCIVVFFDTFSHNIMKNNYVIITMFIMTLEYELFSYLSIWNAKKDTATLLEKGK